MISPNKYIVEIEINKQIKFRKFPGFDFVLQKVVSKALEVNKYYPGVYNISLMLCDDECIRGLNLQYREKNYATNVLSFTGGEVIDGVYFLGDLAISVPCIFREAKEQKKTFRTHFMHMFIHGLLHVMGFDHMTHEEARQMESMEDEILSFIAQ